MICLGGLVPGLFGHRVVSRPGPALPGPRCSADQVCGAVLGASSGQGTLHKRLRRAPLSSLRWNVRSSAPAEPCLSQGLAHILLGGGRMSICPLVRQTRGQASCPGCGNLLACSWSGITRTVLVNAQPGDGPQDATGAPRACRSRPGLLLFA